MHSIAKKPYLASFGRNRGRALSAYQQELVETLLPKIEIGIDEMAKWRNGEIPFFLQFSHSPVPQFASIALEIGFGGGEHLLAQAAFRPETLFIGCEPFLNGVAKCLAGIEQQKLQNIGLFTRDARELIETMPEHSVQEIFILFPDPWPKLRHHKRRLVNSQTLAMLHRIHRPGGRLLIATDHADYSAWILERLLTSPYYRWTAQRPEDFSAPPADWTQTKYQRKTTLAGRLPVFIECLSLPGDGRMLYDRYRHF